MAADQPKTYAMKISFAKDDLVEEIKIRKALQALPLTEEQKKAMHLVTMKEEINAGHHTEIGAFDTGSQASMGSRPN